MLIACQPSPRRQRVYGGIRSSQVDELDSSQLCQSSQATPKLSASQKTGGRDSRIKHTPLFMTQPSQAPATQAYKLYPSSDPPDHQLPDGDVQHPTSVGRPNGTARETSPIPEEDGQDQEDSNAPRSPSAALANGHSAQSSDSASENESATNPFSAPKIYLTLPRHHSASQPQSSFPSLSSLPKEILRIGRSAMPTSLGGTSSQPAPKALIDESDDSDTSSSEEEDIPAGLKGRYAGGSGRKKVKTGGAMKGW